MTETVDAASVSIQMENKNYYLSSSLANIPIDARFLFCLGMVFLITGRDHLDFFSTALLIFFMFPAARDFFYFRRNLGQPFIVLEADCFRIGLPEIRIHYASIKHFVFDQSQQGQTKVAFTLFPKHEGAMAGIRGGHIVGSKEGRVVCRPVKLDGVTAETFFEDFGSRLKAAGAVNAVIDPEVVAGINSTTGNALIIPKKSLSSWLIKIGSFTDMNPRGLKWVSCRLGSWSAIFIVFSLLSIMKNYPRLDFNLAQSVTYALISVQFIAIIPIALLQKKFIRYLDRVPSIANFMEKAGEWKKILLGASVGTAIYLLAVVALQTLIMALQ